MSIAANSSLGAQSSVISSFASRSGLTLVGVFAFAIVVVGMTVGSPLVSLALAGLLSLGSVMIAAGDEPLSIRQATMLGSLHLLGAVFLAA